MLFNNGGVMTPPIDMKTSDGYDVQFGTNVLGHYLFTMSLLPVLIHTAQIRKPPSPRTLQKATDSSGLKMATSGL